MSRNDDFLVEIGTEELPPKALRQLMVAFGENLTAEIDEARRSQVGSGQRSEKIRTYNFPQNRVTDHRVGLSVYSLDRVLDGDLDAFVEELANAEQTKRLEALGN